MNWYEAAVIIVGVLVLAGIAIFYNVKYNNLRRQRAEEVIVDPSRLTHHVGATGELFRPMYLKVRGVEYLAFVIDDGQGCIRDVESKIFSTLTNKSGSATGPTVH